MKLRPSIFRNLMTSNYIPKVLIFLIIIKFTQPTTLIAEYNPKEEVIISNPAQFHQTFNKIKSMGKSQLDFVADYDYTLTKSWDHLSQKFLGTSVSILKKSDLVSDQYKKDAEELWNYYGPLQNDQQLSQQERNRIMEEWLYHEFKCLMNENQININQLKMCVQYSDIFFRYGASELFEILAENQIHSYIVSAGFSFSIIQTLKLLFEPSKFQEIFIRNEKEIFKFITVISNDLIFDRNSNLKDYKRPIITPINKQLFFSKSKFPLKQNAILAGDMISDLKLLEQSYYKNVIKVGFYNFPDNSALNEYLQNFDIIIMNDGNLTPIFEILKDLFS